MDLRDIDNKVAEHVMGWKRVEILDGWWHSDEGGYLMRCCHWQPTREIKDAWQVVEQLSDRFHCRISSPFDVGSAWWAGFTPLGFTGWNGRPDYYESGNSACVAICLAALKALRVEVPDA